MAIELSTDLYVFIALRFATRKLIKAYASSIEKTALEALLYSVYCESLSFDVFLCFNAKKLCLHLNFFCILVGFFYFFFCIKKCECIKMNAVNNERKDVAFDGINFALMCCHNVDYIRVKKRE